MTILIDYCDLKIMECTSIDGYLLIFGNNIQVRRTHGFSMSAAAAVSIYLITTVRNVTFQYIWKRPKTISPTTVF